MEQETHWIRTKCGTREAITERSDSCQVCFMITRMSGLEIFNLDSKRKCKTLLAGKRQIMARSNTRRAWASRSGLQVQTVVPVDSNSKTHEQEPRVAVKDSLLN